MGRILMIEFNDGDNSVLDKIMRALEQHPNFEQFRLRNESMLSLPSLGSLSDEEKYIAIIHRFRYPLSSLPERRLRHSYSARPLSLRLPRR